MHRPPSSRSLGLEAHMLSALPSLLVFVLLLRIRWNECKEERKEGRAVFSSHLSKPGNNSPNSSPSYNPNPSCCITRSEEATLVCRQLFGYRQVC